MFTGIVEEIGRVEGIRRLGGGVRLRIRSTKVIEDLTTGDSISINGVCLTVVECARQSFDVEAVEETLAKTTLRHLAVGDGVNLEGASRLGDRLGGHLVQGHVDGVGKVVALERLADSVLMTVEIPSSLTAYVICEGSITIDGVSLTVARLEGQRATISLIPHTLKVTTLGQRKVGDAVNIEVDLIGKYVEKLLRAWRAKPSVTEARLRELGF